MGFTEHSATRSTSPLHFLNPVLLAHSAAQCASSSSSHHNHNAVASSSSHSSSANRKRRSASDISRLLDPSYLPAASAKTKRSASVSVYVDPHGEVHDPDYRHFPIAPIHSNHSNYSGHYSNYNYASSSSPRRSTSNGRRTTSPRPQFDWELALDESALDDEYPPEPEHLPKHYMNTRHPLTRTPSGARQLPKQRPRETSVSTTGTHTASTTTSTSPTGTASTLPTSCEGDGILEAVDAKDDDEESSPFEDDEKASQARVRALEMEMERERARARNGGWEREVNDIKEKEKKGEKKRRRLSKSSEKEKDNEKVSVRRVSFDDVYEAPSRNWDAAPARNSFSYSSPSALPSDSHHEEAFADPIIDDEEELPQTTDYTPTCTQSLRRQWQSLALSFRFGVFRARRRVLRRVQSIISV